MIGLTIIPLSERFTRSTSDACSSMRRFLWMTPMPPCCAIAMASRDSVTVSIAALAIGTFSRMWRVKAERDVDLARQHRRMPRHEQDVVERQRGGEADRNLIDVQNIRSVFPCGPCLPASASALAPWHFLYFLPLPHGQGSLRPTLGSSRFTVRIGVVAAGARGPRRFGDRRAPPPPPRIAPNGELACSDGALSVIGAGRRGAGRRTAGTPGPSSPMIGHQAPQVADDLLVDAILHRREEREALLLVLDERIALAVAAQADAFLQVVEAVEVVLPLRVDDLQHDVALDPVQDRRLGDQRFLLLVLLDAPASRPRRSSAPASGRRSPASPPRPASKPKISVTALVSASRSHSSGSVSSLA